MVSQLERTDPTKAYAQSVVKGKVPANKWIRLACERHLRDLKEGKFRGLVFSKEHAHYAINFIEGLKHIEAEWAGQYFILEPWQKFIVGSLFGWLHAKSRYRRFRTAYVEVPRKNGKSLLAAAIALYMFVADGEPGAQIKCAATTRKQARVVFDLSQAMVRSSPLLRSGVEVLTNNMSVAGTNSNYEPVSAQADSLDGGNTHCAVVDELHAHKTPKVVDVMDSSRGSRRSPLQLEITTSGDDEESVCYEHHDYVRQILDLIFDDDTWFGFIAGIDEDDDWKDRKVWIKANPNYGVSCKADDMAREAAKAMRTPRSANLFKQKRLNVWTNASSPWLDMDAWKACGTDFDREDLAGRECFAGIDLSSKLDLSAVNYVFPPEDEGGIWHLVCDCYMAAERVKKAKERDLAKYDLWEEQGFLTFTDGNIIDYSFIHRDIVANGKIFNIIELPYDPYNATQFALGLVAEGFEMVEIRQGIKSMGEPSKEFEALIIDGRLNHGNNPVLRWMAANTMVRKDANDNYMPDKAKSNKRIDGIVAGIMGVGRAIVYQDEELPDGV